MPKEFKLPDLGEGIHEGEIVDVLVSVGDKVEDGQPVLLVETDKATAEIPAPVTGTVTEIRCKAGEVVKVGDVLMVFEEEGAQAGPVEKSGVPEEKPSKKEAEERPTPTDIERSREEKTEAAQKTAEKVSEEGPKGEPEGPVPASPSTRRLARELKVDLRQVPPSGPGGRVTSEDVRAFAEKPKKEEAPAEKPEGRPEPPKPQAPPRPERPELVERIPLRSVRKATAKHMALAWSQIPHVSHQDEADITDLEAFRKKHKAEVAERGGALSLTVFMLKVAVAAIKAFPRFNSSLDMEAGEIILKRHYDIGVAMDTERGLIVPVIRDVDRKSITELAIELKELAQRVREGKVTAEELIGGTFTITNIGVIGGTGFAPIVNYPQVAILGMAQAKMRPVVTGAPNNYRVVPRLMLPLIIGFDHRVLDGADAARFLRMVAETLENPEKLMMTV
ncbi:MAG: dihydrolipoamide acetyltransferase family protein [Acidobacteriota bacterium]